MPATTNSRLLVTGASGNLGRLVVRHLLHTLNIEPSRIVAGSRNPDKLKEFADLGVQTRRVDFNDETSIKAAAQGVDRVLVISGDDIFGRLEGHKTAVRAFEAAGVKHILYTSLQEADDSVALVAEDHRETERAIRESKIPGHTFLRNGLYFEVALGNISGASKSGQWFSAAKDGKLAAIARDDVARAAAYALASDSTENKVYEITGSEAFTIDEIVAQISKTIEKPIQVVQVSAEDLAKGIAVATGLPEGLATVYASFDTSTAQGFCATATNHYKQLTGVEPQTHEAWLAANKTLLASL
ncbi:Nucleoside-diphosphate sugar epimerase, partial [Globisporangium splendens]